MAIVHMQGINAGVASHVLERDQTVYKIPPQGCQMPYFQTENPDLGKKWNGRCWNIKRPFGLFYGNLVCFVVIRYIL
jgi:hypothetical protein